MNKDYKFSPSKSHHALKDYGLLAKPKEKAFNFKKVGGLKVARISKDHLGVGTYQRRVDKKRVDRLSQVWHPELGGIHVAEIKYRNKYYYQIVDGQHRACASPDKDVDCIVTNTKCPVDNFLMANDKQNVKPVSVDEIFWALHDRAKTVQDKRSKEDLDDVIFTCELFKKYGFTPTPHFNKSDKESDFGVYVSKIHNTYKKRVVHAINSQAKNPSEKFKNYSEEDFIEFRRGVFEDTMKILTSIFRDTFSRTRRFSPIWESCFLFLSKTMEWEYDVDDIIKTLKSAYWLKFGKGEVEKAKKLNCIMDWSDCTHRYAKSIGFVRDQWHQVFIDTYKTSKRIANAE